MKKKQFENYLKDVCLLKKGTIKSRVSNLKRIEKEYGDLDEYYKEDYLNGLLQKLTYNKENKEQHQIDIRGDKCTGFRTLKSALGLYRQFKIYEIDNQNIAIEPQTSSTKVHENYKDSIISALSQINYTKKVYWKEVGKLQADITRALEKEISSLVWKTEEQISDKYRDAVDILGYDREYDTYIVIELDTTRADQVSKKFISRQALMADKNVFYVSVCYPGTEKMNINECAKYFKYCANVTELLSSGNFKKEYLGYFLKSNDE